MKTPALVLRRFHEQELQIASIGGWALQGASITLVVGRIVTRNKRYTRACWYVLTARSLLGLYEQLLRRQLGDPLADPEFVNTELHEMFGDQLQNLAQIMERLGASAPDSGPLEPMPEPAAAPWEDPAWERIVAHDVEPSGEHPGFGAPEFPQH